MMYAQATHPETTAETRWQAVLARDAAADGRFYWDGQTWKPIPTPNALPINRVPGLGTLQVGAPADISIFDLVDGPAPSLPTPDSGALVREGQRQDDLADVVDDGGRKGLFGQRLVDHHPLGQPRRQQ